MLNRTVQAERVNREVPLSRNGCRIVVNDKSHCPSSLKLRQDRLFASDIRVEAWVHHASYVACLSYRPIHLGLELLKEIAEMKATSLEWERMNITESGSNPWKNLVFQEIRHPHRIVQTPCSQKLFNPSRDDLPRRLSSKLFLPILDDLDRIRYFPKPHVE